MGSTETDKIEILRETFATYWEHVRHQETQRLSFLNTFSTITVGVFALIFTEFLINQTIAQILLLVLVILLAIMGIFATISWRIAFQEYKSLADSILERTEIGLKELVPYKNRPRRKPMSAHFAVVVFYDLVIALSSALLLWLLYGKKYNCYIVVLSSTVLVISLALSSYVATNYEKRPSDKKGEAK